MVAEDKREWIGGVREKVKRTRQGGGGGLVEGLPMEGKEGRAVGGSSLGGGEFGT